MTVALAVRTDAVSALDALAYEPQNLREAMDLAKAMFGGGLLPRSIKSAQDLLLIMMTGRELGISTATAIRSIHVIEGKPTLSADLVVALVKRRREVCEYFIYAESSNTRCVVETKRIGSPKAERFEYTLEDAKGAGLLAKDNWRKHPADMLAARCSMRAARKVYPDLAMNIYDPDELQDVGQGASPAAQAAAPRELNPSPQPAQEVLPPEPAPVVTAPVDRTKEKLRARQAARAAVATPAKAPTVVATRTGPALMLEFGPRSGTGFAELTMGELADYLQLAEADLEANPNSPYALRMRGQAQGLREEMERRKDELAP